MTPPAPRPAPPRHRARPPAPPHRGPKALLGAGAALTALVVGLGVLTAPPPGADPDGPDTASAAGPALGPPRPRADRPNVVLLMTDDQTADDLRWMPQTRRLLGGHGTTFTDALAPEPLCCPARANVLTGEYGHNNGVQFNNGPHGGFAALSDPDNHLGSWLREAGYHTAYVGKFLNGFRTDEPAQVGWTHWTPATRLLFTYRATRFVDDGELEIFGRNVTSVVSDYTADYVREFSREDRPFFLWAAHVAPHEAFSVEDGFIPPRPTPRHRDDLTGVRAPSLRGPAFGRADLTAPYADRQERVTRRRVQELYTARLQSLLDVDDAVGRLVRVLRQTGELDDTYIVLTSDNGMLLGEHDLLGKSAAYDEALRVPLVVRVPGAASASRSSVPVTLADLAPTVLDLAGATPGRLQDGASFAGLLAGRRTGWRDTQLVQTGSASAADGWESRGVRTRRWTFLRRSDDGAEFLYDRRADPAMLTNLVDRPSHRRTAADLRARLAALLDCAGSGCRPTFGPVAEPADRSAQKPSRRS